MKKVLSFIILSVLLATPALHANAKVHFEGDITKTTIYALPSWIETVPMEEADWLIVVEAKQIRDFSKKACLTTASIGALIGGIVFGVLGASNDYVVEGAVSGGFMGSLSGWLLYAFFQESLPRYSMSYKLIFRNLKTGSNKKQNIKIVKPGRYSIEETIETGRKKLARKIAHFFEGYNQDNSPPQIALVSPFDQKEYTTSVEEVTMRLSVNDDVELSKVVIYKDGRTYQTFSAAGGNRMSKSLDIPLELGYNKFKVTAFDWMNKSSTTDEITIFRSKGGGDIPRTPDPPELAVKVKTPDQTNTLMGGTFGGVIVTIHNGGKGYADNVKVSLFGDSQLCDALGNTKEIEEIAPGDSAVVSFKRRLPDDLDQKQTRLKVSVTADNYSVSKEDALTLNLLPKPEDVDTDIPSSGIRRDGYALIIGISQYQRTRGPQYALNDAEVFSLYAEKVLGIPAANIELLFDEEATWRTVRSKIEALGSRSGFTVLYFSGHGSFDVANPRSQEAFLAPYDWDPEDASSLLSVDWLLDEVEPGSDDTSLVILDACFTGGEGRSVEYAAKPAVMAQLPTQHSSIVMASSEGFEISLENEYTRHGMFTYYLLSGLRGNAAAEGGWIYLDDLYDYVHDQVKAATNNSQTPVLKGESANIKLGRSR